MDLRSEKYGHVVAAIIVSRARRVDLFGPQTQTVLTLSLVCKRQNRLVSGDWKESQYTRLEDKQHSRNCRVGILFQSTRTMLERQSS